MTSERLLAISPPPPFCFTGIFMQISSSVASLQSVSMFTSTAYQDPTRRLVPNAQNALVNTIITKSGGFVVVPAFLEEWALMPEFVKGLSGLLYVSYPGSPLSKKAGDALVDAGMKLECVYGTTEVTAFTTCGCIPGDQKEWEWVRRGLNKRIRREPVGDETLECQMLVSEGFRQFVCNVPQESHQWFSQSVSGPKRPRGCISYQSKHRLRLPYSQITCRTTSQHRRSQGRHCRC
ncbi:hypothetical protein F5141DRAFT_231052 [Pisolithus sp. B1]|nr:hypothetical protein F5141DRAFT_231052 [Pisolithus sp. B1]